MAARQCGSGLRWVRDPDTEERPFAPCPKTREKCLAQDDLLQYRWLQYRSCLAPMTPSVTMRIPPELVAYVDERAKKRGISRTEWVVTMIEMVRSGRLIEPKKAAK